MAGADRRILSTSEIAEVLGVTDRWVRELEKAGIINKISRGKFDLVETVQNYIAWLKSEKEETEEELDLKKEKAKLTKANREKVETELQIMRGELHRSEDVRVIMNDMLSSFRARCLAIPTKTAPKVQGVTDLTVIQNAIKDDIYEALRELADYDPQVFYQRSKDKLALNGGEKEKAKEKPPKGKRQNGKDKKE